MKYLFLILKLIFTFCLIYYAMMKINFADAKKILLSFKGLEILAFSVLIVLIHSIFAGLRIKPIVALFNGSISHYSGIGLWFLGSFCSQILISFVGGDSMRVISLIKMGLSPKVAIKAIFLDRSLGFISIQIIFLCSTPYLIKISTSSQYWALVSLAFISFLMIFIFIIMGLLSEKFANFKFINKLFNLFAASRHLFLSKRISFKILILGCAMQLCNVILIYYLTNTLGGNISLLQSASIGSAVLLIAMLPISIAGWGVRENAMVIGYGLIGLPKEIAISVSIIIGLAFLIGSIPGCFLVFTAIRSPALEMQENLI